MSLDIPIIFSAAMVRALLDGSKTMTRRMLYSERRAKSGIIPASASVYARLLPDGSRQICQPVERVTDLHIDCYHVLTGWERVQPGDRLWCRESIKFWSNGHDCQITYCDDALMDTGPNTGQIPEASLVSYFRFADKAAKDQTRSIGVPSIHQPRWASRLTLIVDSVKVERLRDMSHEDAMREGVVRSGDYYGVKGPAGGWLGSTFATAPEAFRYLWMSLHGAASWDANPWVVAVGFRVVMSNIDQIAKSGEN